MASLRFVCINDGADTVAAAVAADRHSADRARAEQALQTLTARYRRALMLYAEGTDADNADPADRKRKCADAEAELVAILAHDQLQIARPALAAATTNDAVVAADDRAARSVRAPVPTRRLDAHPRRLTGRGPWGIAGS